MRKCNVLVVGVLIVVIGACGGGSKKATTGGGGASTSTSASAAGSPPPTAAATALKVSKAAWQLPAARSREVVLAGAHALFVIGGQDASGASTARVWNVPLPAGTTTRLATLPQAAHDAGGAVLGSDVFVFGGGEAQTIPTVQRYRAGAAAVVGKLPQPRSDLVAATIGDTAYVLGGFDGTNGTPDVLATTDGVHFRTVAKLPETVRYPAVAVVDNRIFLFGGDHNGTFVTTVQVVDPAEGTATIAGQLPQTLAHASAVVVGGNVLIAGGRHAGQVSDGVLQYDVASAKVTSVARLPYAVADAGAAVVDGVGYIVGGETPAKTASAITLSYG